jgi:hypothetical protein
MAYDPNYFLKILEEATGESKDWNKRRIKQNRIGEIKSELNSSSYNLDDNPDKTLLTTYLSDLQNHKQKAQKIKLIKQNFADIENIFDTLQAEVNNAKEEERTLEKLAEDLDDKKVQQKIKNYDRPEIRKLNKKLKHLIKMKNEMEDREQTVEQISNNFNDISHALNQRIDLVQEILDKDDGGSPNKPKIVSVSDVQGIRSGGYEQCINLLSRSNNFPSLRDGNYKLVINGNAMNDKNGVEKDSENMLNVIKGRAGSDNFRYTFGHTDQFILFKEFWCAIGKQSDYDEPYFAQIDDNNNRKWFIDQIRRDDGCFYGVWNGDFEYNYTNASPIANFNDKLKSAGEAMYELMYDNSSQDPSDILNDAQIKSIFDAIENKPSLTIITDSSNNDLGEDLDRNNPGEMEAMIALQFLIQFADGATLSRDDYDEIFNPDYGAIWVDWDDLVNNDPGRFIVGRTKSSECNEGTPIFDPAADENPREANGGDLINERTIPDGYPNSIIIEEPGGNITALRDDGSGNVEEESI